MNDEPLDVKPLPNPGELLDAVLDAAPPEPAPRSTPKEG
jgi:hypothetical protein